MFSTTCNGGDSNWQCFGRGYMPSPIKLGSDRPTVKGIWWSKHIEEVFILTVITILPLIEFCAGGARYCESHITMWPRLHSESMAIKCCGIVTLSVAWCWFIGAKWCLMAFSASCRFFVGNFFGLETSFDFFLSFMSCLTFAKACSIYCQITCLIDQLDRNCLIFLLHFGCLSFSICVQRGFQILIIPLIDINCKNWISDLWLNVYTE